MVDRDRIPDARMIASSFYSNYTPPYYSRLNESSGHGGWCPKTRSDRTDYLQVDMGEVRFLWCGHTRITEGLCMDHQLQTTVIYKRYNLEHLQGNEY